MFADDHALEGFVVKDTPACQLADAVRIADGNGWL